LSRFEIRGRSVLITGASSGIGASLARELGRRGARLALVARRSELLDLVTDRVESDGGPRPVSIPADLSRRGECGRVAAAARDALGQIDVLVNNAGTGVGGFQWVVADRDEPREAFEVNLWSPLALTGLLLPEMRARRGGAVVNVTSMVQVMPLWMLGHYAATKAALAQATETLRWELRGSGVHVMQVIPGPIDTAIMGESRLVPGFERLTRNAPIGDADRLARRVVRALELGRPRVIYPRALRLLYALPGLWRPYVAWMRGRLDSEIDLDDLRVVRAGSHGDPEAREARRAWEEGSLGKPAQLAGSPSADRRKAGAGR
jgi:uncharacterized protein